MLTLIQIITRRRLKISIFFVWKNICFFSNTIRETINCYSLFVLKFYYKRFFYAKNFLIDRVFIIINIIKKKFHHAIKKKSWILLFSWKRKWKTMFLFDSKSTMSRSLLNIRIIDTLETSFLDERGDFTEASVKSNSSSVVVSICSPKGKF